MEKNPVLIQKANRRFKNAIPLFLIHDAGGTVLPYYFLDSLSRDVWGITYPYLYDDTIVKGGLIQVADIYAGLVRKKMPRGQILLGGWSAGGALAMQVCKSLENDTEIKVAGLIMLDTPYPVPPKGWSNSIPICKITIPFSSNEPIDNQKAQQKTFDSFLVAMSEWKLPKWKEGRPPKTVFIRVLQSLSEEGEIYIDWYRDYKCLNWDNYHDSFIIRELTVHGNHFSIFKPENLPELSLTIQEACQILSINQAKYSH